MASAKTQLLDRMESSNPIMLAEITPPASGDPAPFRAAAERFAGKVDAVGISDNRGGVAMSPLAAASLALQSGVEPILHLATRDRNRIALISDVLGAKALGIPNILCTSGEHQTLGKFGAARNVYDIDPIQLMHAITSSGADAALVGESDLDVGPCCLGAVASPFADPAELQTMRLVKKVAAGAKFLVTQPVFDIERFLAWWEEVCHRGIQKQVAIVAGIRVLGDAEKAAAYAAKRPLPLVPQAMLERLAAKPGAEAQRAEAATIALETAERLSALDGLRGFEISSEGDDAAVLQVLDRLSANA